MKPFLRIITIGAVLAMCVCRIAAAQVFIEDGKVKLSAAPGENVTGTLILHNTSDKDVDMKVYWEDFVYKPPYDGSKDFLPMGTTDSSAADWVTFSTNTLMFGPFAKRTVQYTVNTPDIFDRGHYGVLFFENAEKKASAQKGLNVVTRVGCLFFIEPAAKDKTADLKDYVISRDGIDARFVNAGNVILVPDGTFYIIDKEGTVFDRGAMEKIYLPPGKEAPYRISFSRDIVEGEYTAVLTISLEDDDVIVREVDFSKSGPMDLNISDIRD